MGPHKNKGTRQDHLPRSAEVAHPQYIMGSAVAWRWFICYLPKTHLSEAWSPAWQGKAGQPIQAVRTYQEVFRSLKPLLVERTKVILIGPMLVIRRSSLGKSKSSSSQVSELLSHTTILLTFTEISASSQHRASQRGLSDPLFKIKLLTQVLCCGSEN